MIGLRLQINLMSRADQLIEILTEYIFFQMEQEPLEELAEQYIKLEMVRSGILGPIPIT